MVAIVLKRHLSTFIWNTAGFGEGHLWWDGAVCYVFVSWTWTLLELRLLRADLLQK